MANSENDAMQKLHHYFNVSHLTQSEKEFMEREVRITWSVPCYDDLHYLYQQKEGL
jgi:predicted DNA binding CopG/RHH family protein